MDFCEGKVFSLARFFHSENAAASVFKSIAVVSRAILCDGFSSQAR